MPLISLRRVSFGYERSRPPVVEDVTIDVAPGDRIAVIGPSGSGKSSLLTLLAGRTRAWSGMIDTSATTTLVDQGARSFLRRTAIDNAALGVDRSLRWGDARDAAQEILSALGLGAVSHRPCWSLSGGERQRVCVARALLGDHQVVLLDEPTAQLNRDTADVLVRVTTERIAAPRAVIVATHDVRLLAHFDSVFEVAGGRVRQTRPPASR